MDGKLASNAADVINDLERQIIYNDDGETYKPEYKDVSTTVLGSVKDTATKGAQILSDKAVEISQETRNLIKEQVDSSREVLTSTLGDAAKVVKQVGSESESPIISSLKPYTERVGQWLDNTSDYLNKATPQRILKDTKALARTNPALFVGGALALGLLAARFIKSTDEEV